MPLPHLHRNGRESRRPYVGAVPPGRYLATTHDNPLASVPAGRSPHSLSQQGNVTAETVLPGPGRPPLELELRNQRAVVGVFLTRRLPEQTLTNSIREVGGPARQYVRGLLGKLLGANDESDNALGRFRLKGPPELHQKREEQQKKAYKAYCQQELGGSEPEYQQSVAEDPTGDQASQRRTRDFSLGRLATVLGGAKETGFYLFRLKRLSNSKSTIASRLSTRSPCPAVRSLNTDFRRHYYERQGPESVIPFSTQNTAPPSETVLSLTAVAVAVGTLFESWLDGIGDDAALKRLQAAFPESEDEQLRFVNAADCRGVTPLHLATAYGYIKTCRFLICHHANCKARTANNESIRTFSRPAERLAKNDICLSTRILNCREHVSMGMMPPEPKAADMTQATSLKRPRKIRKKDSHGLKRGSQLRSQESRANEGTLRSTTTGTASTLRREEPFDARLPHFGSQIFASPASTIRQSVESFSNFVPDRSGFVSDNTIRQTTTAPHLTAPSMPVDPISNKMIANRSGENLQPSFMQARHKMSKFDTGNRRTPLRRPKIYDSMDELTLIPQYRSPSSDAGAPRGSEFNQLSGILPTAMEHYRTDLSDTNMQRLTDTALPESPHDDSTSVFDFAHGDRTYVDPNRSPMQNLPAQERHANPFAGDEQFPENEACSDSQDYIPLRNVGAVRTEPPWYTRLGVIPSPSPEGSQWILPPTEDSQRDAEPQGMIDQDPNWLVGNRQPICASCGGCAMDAAGFDDISLAPDSQALCHPCWLFLQNLHPTAAPQQ